MNVRCCIAILLTALVGIPAGAADPPKESTAIRVTVVVILASKTDKEINPKLKDLAEEVQKRNEELTGFKMDTVLQKSITPGDTYKFEIRDEQKVTIKIEKKDKNGRVDLTVTPPGMDAISYTCACDKFFPVVTPHKTKKGEQMIIAILVKPCTGKGP